MYILGIHFGHDASISIIKNGKVIYCMEIERHNRIRHAIGVNYEDIQNALIHASCDIKNIKYCTITSTQNIEYFFPEPKKFKFEYDFKSSFFKKNLWKKEFDKLPLRRRLDYKIKNSFLKNKKNIFLKRIKDEFKNLANLETLGSIEKFIMPNKWKKKVKIKNLDDLIFKNKFNENLSNGMYLPISVTINEIKIPGFIVSHHMSHASYAFYMSPFSKAAILSHDGSFAKDIYRGGMCYYGDKNRIYPVMPHHLEIGRFYEGLSCYLGFGNEEGPGKLMGLAPYGKPVFFDKKFVGNKFSFKEKKNYEYYEKQLLKINQKIKYNRFKTLESWVIHCLSIAKTKGYKLENFGKLEKILDPINIDIAASTQKIFEETMLNTVNKVFYSFENAKLKTGFNLCLTGGTNLNCPSNTNIFLKSEFKKVSVPPAIHDGGLSTGSALYVYHNVLKKIKRFKHSSSQTVYLGPKYQKISTKELKSKYKKLKFSECKNISKKIAILITKNKIIAVCHGRSEVGPRALGNRSILANATYKNNWKKVNEIKSRELWRPFAPVVLKTDFSKWFESGPKISPFMLFTAKIKKNIIPATTHVDNTARVQTVSKENESLFPILNELKKIKEVPILLNTSFNGPGQPIIETQKQALDFFLKSKLDFLVIDNLLVEKK